MKIRVQGSGARGTVAASSKFACTLVTLLAAAMVLTLSGCSDDGPKYNGPQTGLPYTPTPPPADPVALIKTDAGDITVELFEEDAPNTVANFIELAEKKAYDGLKFHRIVKGFMIQGGDPKGDGSGGPGYKFPDEVETNANKNDQYALSMANSGPNTNGSQFFIVTNPTGAHWLDGKHTVFGKVTKGKEVVDKLDNSPVVGEKPTPDVKILSIQIVSKRNHEYKVADSVPDTAAPPSQNPSLSPTPPMHLSAPAHGPEKKIDVKPEVKPPAPAKTDAKPEDKKAEPAKVDAKPEDKQAAPAKPDEKK